MSCALEFCCRPLWLCSWSSQLCTKIFLPRVLLVEASAFPRPCCLDPFASPTVVKRDAIEGHDSSWVPSNSWQRGGGDSSARPRRPKLRRFGPHRLSGRSPPLQPAAARGRRAPAPAPKGHTTSFKAQWARRSRSSIVAHPQGNFCRPHRKCYRGSPCGFRGPANPEPVAHNGTAVVAGTRSQPVGHAAAAAVAPFT